jgi:sulfatase maturation enzyme AslB (radical SAM superfamily)
MATAIRKRLGRIPGTELEQLSQALAAKLYPEAYGYVLRPLCEPDCAYCMEWRREHAENVRRIATALDEIERGI